jgi:hypothetical protein
VLTHAAVLVGPVMMLLLQGQLHELYLVLQEVPDS